MLIKEWLIKNELARSKDRYDSLVRIGAPAIMIEMQEKLTTDLMYGNFECNGDTSLLGAEMVSFKVKKGRGGKEYVLINGDTMYFPKAKHGRFIAAVEEKVPF